MEEFRNYLRGILTGIFDIIWMVCCLMIQQVLNLYLIVKPFIMMILRIIYLKGAIRWIELLEYKVAKTVTTWFTKAFGVTNEEYAEFETGLEEPEEK